MHTVNNFYMSNNNNNFIESLLYSVNTTISPYYEPLQFSYLIMEYNFHTYSFNYTKFFNTLENLDRSTSKNIENQLNIPYTRVINDLLQFNKVVENITSSLWYNEFLLFLDKPAGYTTETNNNFLNIEREVFIELLLKKDMDRFLNMGIWLLGDSNILEVTTPIFLKLIESLSLIYLAFIVQLFVSSSYMPEKKDSIDYNHFASYASSQSEKELGSIDDLLNTGLLIVFIFSWILNQLLCYNVLTYFPAVEMGVSSFSIFIFTLALNLFFILIDLGVLFLIFLRGCTKRTDFLYESLADYVFLFSYFARTIIQNLRVVVISIFYFFYMHTIEDQTPEIFGNSLSFSIKDFSNPSINSYTIFLELTKATIQVIYESIHLTTIIFSQLFSFMSVIFWLFNTLYFSYESVSSEKMLSIRRRFFNKKFPRI